MFFKKSIYIVFVVRLCISGVLLFVILVVMLNSCGIFFMCSVIIV